MRKGVSTAVTAPALAPPSAAPQVHRLGGLAKAVEFGLGACIFTDLAVAIHAIVDNRMLGPEIDNPGSVTPERLQLSDQLMMITGLAQALVFLVTAVLFLVWFGRSAANLKRWSHPRHGTAFSVVSWFIPIVSLWIPKQAANDIWRAGEHREVPGYVHAWWALFLITSLLYNVIFGYTPSQGDFEEFRTLNNLEIAGSAVSIVTAVLAIKLVRDASARHARRADEPWQPPVQPAHAGWTPPSYYEPVVPDPDWKPEGGTHFNLENGWKRTD